MAPVAAEKDFDFEKQFLLNLYSPVIYRFREPCAGEGLKRSDRTLAWHSKCSRF